MPHRDGTGPTGGGPRTGRGKGRCQGEGACLPAGRGRCRGREVQLRDPALAQEAATLRARLREVERLLSLPGGPRGNGA